MVYFLSIYLNAYGLQEFDLSIHSYTLLLFFQTMYRMVLCFAQYCYMIVVCHTHIREEVMNTQFKKGILEMCILALISQNNMYGFEVIETLSKEIDVNENTVYPILRRLTKQGLFDTYTEETSIGAPRKYYKMTNLGKNKLETYEIEWRSFLSGVFNILGGKHEK